MAGSASDWAELKILEHLVGKTSWTMPSTPAIALMLGDPGEAGTGAAMQEVANSNNYARKAVSGSDWNTASAGHIDNANAITLNQASGSWGTVTHWALVTSPVWGEGKIIAYGDLTTPKAIDSGDTPEFAAGDIDINCS